MSGAQADNKEKGGNDGIRQGAGDTQETKSIREKNLEIIAKLLEISKNRIDSGNARGVNELVTLAQVVVFKQEQFENRNKPNLSGWVSNFNNFNLFYWVFTSIVLLASLVFNFIYYVFDTDGVLTAYREISGSKSTRKGNDQRRLLHLAWHCSAYVPILAITIVAWIVLKTGWEAIFFLCLASSAVSLEICLSVILDKVHNLQDLSRQTTRAVRQFRNSNGDLCIKWIEYFRLRLQHERTGVAKAALVTIFSVVLFSVVLGIEALTIWKHHQVEELLESKSKAIEKMILDQHPGSASSGSISHRSAISPPPVDIDQETDETSTELIFKASVREYAIELLYDKKTSLPIAAFCAALLFVISVFKLWIQTRHVLENADPIDRYITPLAALDAFLEIDRRQDSTDYLSGDQSSEVAWD